VVSKDIANRGNNVSNIEQIGDSLQRTSNLRGLWFMTAGFASFSCADTMAKVLTADYHPVQIAWTRQFGVVAVVLVVLLLKGPALFKSVAPGIQLVRGLCATVSAVSFIFAIRYVPLADAVAVSFIAPFIVTALGATLLGEPVGIRRWTAVTIGFIGTIVIVRPGLGIFHPAIFLVVVAALAFAARQIVSRHIGTRDPTMTTLAYTATTSFMVLILPLAFYWHPPKNTTHLVLMVGLTLMSGLGEFLMIKALEIAHAVVVSPMHYTLILFSTFWGYMVFGDFPDFWTLAGTVIVISSGLYVIYRERLRKVSLP
jgi:drug/metabolite transporter (DMT)-like permease